MKFLGLDKLDINEEALKLIKIQMLLDIVAATMGSFVAPIIRLEMARMVDPIFYQMSDFIQYGLGIVLNLGIDTKMLKFIKKHFRVLCIIDAVTTIFVNIAFSHMANARFISLAILGVLVTGLMFRVFADIYNNLTSGTDLTILQSRKAGFYKLALVLGSGGVVIFTYFNVSIDIDTALHIQCIALIIDCLVSVFITNKLIKYQKKKDEE